MGGQVVRALVDLKSESVGLPACLAKSLKAIMGGLQYAQTSGATSIQKYLTVLKYTWSLPVFWCGLPAALPLSTASLTTEHRVAMALLSLPVPALVLAVVLLTATLGRQANTG